MEKIFNCEYCEKTFFSKRTKKTCSKKCAIDYRAKKRKSKTEKFCFTCVVCGILKEVPLYRYRHKKYKTCSRKCQYEYQKSELKKFTISCPNCKKEFFRKHKTQLYCSNRCTPKIKAQGWWMENGYKVLYTQNGKGIKEHIKIMEEHLGRKVDRKKEDVHHINGIKTDNRIENLQVMSRSDHMRLHREQDKKNGITKFGRYAKSIS